MSYQLEIDERSWTRLTAMENQFQALAEFKGADQ